MTKSGFGFRRFVSATARMSPRSQLRTNFVPEMCWMWASEM